MDIFGNLANAASSIAKGGSASDALQVAGEATLNDVLGGSKIPSAAPSPTANVSVAPGVAASPVASSPGYKVNVPWLGPVPIAIAVIGGLALAYVGYKYILPKLK